MRRNKLQKFHFVTYLSMYMYGSNSCRSQENSILINYGNANVEDQYLYHCS